MVCLYLWPIHIRSDSFYPGLRCGGSFFAMRSCFGLGKGFWPAEEILRFENQRSEMCSLLPRLAPVSGHLSHCPRAVVREKELIPSGRRQAKDSWACRSIWIIPGTKHTPPVSWVNTPSLSWVVTTHKTEMFPQDKLFLHLFVCFHF